MFSMAVLLLGKPGRDLTFAGGEAFTVKPVPRRTKRSRINKTRLIAYVVALVLILYAGKTAMSFYVTWVSRVDYDLVVIGGEPEGVAAAVAAARSGLDVLLVDPYEELGGRLVQGKTGCLIPDRGPEGDLLNQGLFLELYRELAGGRTDLKAAREALERMVQAEESLFRLPQRRVIDVRVRRERIVSIGLDDGQRIRASRFIDATPEATAARLAGANFTRGTEEIRFEDPVPVSLVMEMGGLDWEIFTSGTPLVALKNQGNNRPSIPDLGAPNESNHLAHDHHDHMEDREDQSGALVKPGMLLYPEIMSRYQALDPLIETPGLLVVQQDNGTALVEAIFIYGVDPLECESREEAWLRGEREAEFLVRFLRQNIPGLEDAFLAVLAPRVKVWETSGLESLYRLTLEDILEHRDFWDKIALSSSPATHPGMLPGQEKRILGNPALYSVPFRCLVPAKLTNLLVVGSSAGYDFLAQGSAGKMPLGINVAQAAGIAAAVSLEKEVHFHQLSRDEALVASLQERLIHREAYLRNFRIPYPLEGHPHYPALRQLRSWGLLSGGYENDYRLGDPVKIAELDEMLEAYLERVFQRRHSLKQVREEHTQATFDDLLDALDHISEIDLYTMELGELMVRYNFYPGRLLNRGEAFAFLVDFVEIMKE